jgi:hypothetical protein
MMMMFLQELCFLYTGEIHLRIIHAASASVKAEAAGGYVGLLGMYRKNYPLKTLSVHSLPTIASQTFLGDIHILPK